MTQAILFTALVPLALLLVLGFVLLSGRMSEAVRRRVELGLILIAYPAFILTWASQAWAYQQEGDWFMVSIMLVLIASFAVQFVLALRTRTLFPRFRKA
ncbi:hypothetical protein [Brevundimonas sp. Root1423]|uniref:hypothetical protein n=1 Tax=Brevundimonas sp. Root1423 TaxID=1736462 RepID=UPI0007017A02|nr:hypothetical protein [Brevundimonas sp. Root1423]KQY75262.1 hypothetical protein ASD25_11940 [Brevundimonas sp. Root1423]